MHDGIPERFYEKVNFEKKEEKKQQQTTKKNAWKFSQRAKS